MPTATMLGAGSCMRIASLAMKSSKSAGCMQMLRDTPQDYSNHAELFLVVLLGNVERVMGLMIPLLLSMKMQIMDCFLCFRIKQRSRSQSH